MKKSFSLVEVLVAISVLLIGTIGVTFLVNTAVKTATSTRSNLIASQLAQGGIEIARRLRDENFIVCAEASSTSSCPAFHTGLIGVQRADWLNGLVTPSAGNQFLKLHPQYGYSYFTDGTEITTSFERNIDISIVNTNEIKVEVTVIWSDRGSTKSFTVEDHFFNWR